MVKTAKLDVGFIQQEGTGSELDLLIFAGCVAILLLGPGAASLDRAVGLEPMRRWGRSS